MDIFVRLYQPEKHAAWIAGKDVGPHPENDQSKLYAGSRSRSDSGSVCVWLSFCDIRTTVILSGRPFYCMQWTAVNCGRLIIIIIIIRFVKRQNVKRLPWFCFWRRQSVVFCLCVKYLGNCWTDLRQIHREDMFGPSLGRVWRSWQRSRSLGTENGIFRSVRRSACGLRLVKHL